MNEMRSIKGLTPYDPVQMIEHLIHWEPSDELIDPFEQLCVEDEKLDTQSSSTTSEREVQARKFASIKKRQAKKATKLKRFGVSKKERNLTRANARRNKGVVYNTPIRPTKPLSSKQNVKYVKRKERKLERAIEVSHRREHRDTKAQIKQLKFQAKKRRQLLRKRQNVDSDEKVVTEASDFWEHAHPHFSDTAKFLNLNGINDLWRFGTLAGVTSLAGFNPIKPGHLAHGLWFPIIKWYHTITNYLWMIRHSPCREFTRRLLWQFVYSEHQYYIDATVFSRTIEGLCHLFHKKETNFVVTESSSIGAYAGKGVEMISFIRSTISSTLFASLRDFLLMILSFNIFDKDLTHQLSRWIGKPKKVSIIGLLDHIAEILSNFLKFGEAIDGGMSIKDVLNNGSPIRSLELTYNRLYPWKDSLYTGVPIEGRKDAISYFSEVKEIYDKSTLLGKAISVTSPDYADYHALHFRITNLRNQISSMLASSDRLAPAAIVLHGRPGVGKSKFLQLIYRCWSKVKGRDFRREHVYTKVMSSEYWDGVDDDKVIYHFSELGRSSKGIVEKQGDPVLHEVLSLIDDLSLPLNMAQVDGKGKVFAHPELVTADTNNMDLHVKTLMYCPTATYRRFHYFEIEPRPEYSTNGMIDSAKAMASSDPLNVWIVSVKKYNGSSFETIFKSENIHEFTRWFHDYFTSYVTKAEAVRAAFSDESMFEFLNEAKTESEDLGDSSEYSSDEESCYEGPPSYTSRVTSYILGSCRKISWSLLTLGSSFFMDKFLSIFGGLLSIFRVYLLLLLTFLFTWNCFGIVPSCMAVIGILLVLSSIPDFQKARQYFQGCVTSETVNLSHEYNKLKYNLSGSQEIKDVNIMSSKYLGLIALLGTVIAGLTIYFNGNRESIIPEDRTIFPDDEEESKIINELEETYHCGDSLTRVATKSHKIWNTFSSFKPSSHTGDINSLSNLMSRNIRRCMVSADSARSGTYVLGIRGDYALINTHALKGREEVSLKVSTTGFLDEKNKHFIVSKIRLADSVEIATDLLLVRLSGIRFKDITTHLCNEDKYPDHSKAMIAGNSVYAIMNRKPLTVTDATIGAFQHPITWSYDWHDHRTGLCGLPLLIYKGRFPCVAGVHCAGGSKSPRSYAIPINLDMISNGIAELRQKDSSFEILSESSTLTLGGCMPVVKSPFRFENFHGIEYHGKETGLVLVNNKSKLTMTKFYYPLREYLLDQDFYPSPTEDFAPPLMKPTMRDGEYVSPYNYALRKICKTKPALNKRVLRRIERKFLRRVLKKLKGRGITELNPLTVDQAINGFLDDPFLRRMNASTSPGFGWTGKKSDHIPLVDDFTRLPTKELKLRIIEVLESYKKGESAHFVYKAQLKDEPRAVEKVRIGKTRLFYMAPIEAVIISRMFLAPLYTLMVQHGDIFCTGVGIDMHTDADGLFRRLRSMSDFFFEGDFSGFDVSLLYDISKSVANFIVEFFKAVGYNDAALEAVRGILTDGLFTVVSLNLDIFTMAGAQPSGKYGTAEDNSLKLLFMIMYFWEHTYPEHDFFECVILYTYGDDVLGTIHKDFIERFNNITFQSFCKDHYNCEFTSSTKSMTLEKFLSPEDCSFLKRNFRKHAQLERWVAPLSFDSLVKMLSWRLPSNAVSTEDQMLSSCCSFAREIYFHSDEKNFASIYSFIQKIMEEEYGIPIEIFRDTVPGWAQLTVDLSEETPLL